MPNSLASLETHALTLVISQGSGITPDDLVALAHDASRAAGLTPGVPDWLAEGHALDVPCNLPGELHDARAAVRQVLAAAAIDWCLQPGERRRKRLLIADMDSTIIEQECLDLLAEATGKTGAVAELTAAAMRGDIDFASSARQRVALLTGTTRALIGRLVEERITLSSGAVQLVATMRASGALCLLVSGGFEDFVAPIAKRVGFDSFHANRFTFIDEALAGVEEPVQGADAKLAALGEAAHRARCLPADAVAIGDGANDVPMLAAAGLGIAYHAKPAAMEVADAAIVHCDLTTALFFQGYRAAEFAV